MGLIKKLKELQNSMDVNNNRIGYKFNKWLFNIMILLMIFLVLFVWVEYDFADIRQPHLFYECEKPNAICTNELYTVCNPDGELYYRNAKICEEISPDMYEKQFLLGGESIGQQPSFLAENIGFLFLNILILSLVLNHLIFNKRGEIG